MDQNFRITSTGTLYKSCSHTIFKKSAALVCDLTAEKIGL